MHYDKPKHGADESYLQYDNNSYLKQRRSLKRHSKELAKVHIAETFNEFGGRRMHAKHNDELLSEPCS